MVRKDEEVERLKHKLWLYGSYTRGLEWLEKRADDIEQELTFNDDIQKAAHNLGAHGDGPYHPADKQLQLERTSIPFEIEQIERERSYLGIDKFIESLCHDDWMLMRYVYVCELSQAESGVRVGLSRRAVQKNLDKIYERVRTCPQ